MGGLFGSAQKTTITTKPAPQVEALLKKIVSQTENEDLGSYIAHQFANFSPEEQQQIQQLAQSGQLRQASAALSPAMLKGLDQMSAVNKQLGDVANNGITAEEVLQNKNALQGGLYQGVQRSAASAGNVAGRLGSATARSVARRGASQQQAAAAINPSLTNVGIDLAANKRANQLSMTGLQNNLAEGNVDLGLTGMDLGQRAISNQLSTGNFAQQVSNAMNMNNYQNANSAALFPWESVNSKLRTLDQISPMAGSKTVSKGSTPSLGTQIASTGLQGLAIYGNMGGFASGNSKTQTGWLGTGDNAIPEYKMTNQFNNSAGTGLFNRMGWTYGGSK